MSKDIFENTLKALKEIENTKTFTMDIETDSDGFIDKECPNPECLSKFKVNAEDWGKLFSDEKVYCPYCGYSAPASQWFTTEQVEQAQKQASEYLEAKLSNALAQDAREFNKMQSKNSLLQMNMTVRGVKKYIDLPAKALEEMQQEVTCEYCGARYRVIGSAFFCPCCGRNSARTTFRNSIEKVKASIDNLQIIKSSITDKDEGERICDALLEKSIQDLVTAFQRVCECVYLTLPNAVTLKKR